jgi:hypothetical protein
MGKSELALVGPGSVGHRKCGPPNLDPEKHLRMYAAIEASVGAAMRFSRPTS